MEGLSIGRDEESDLDLLVDDGEAREQLKYELCLVGRFFVDHNINYNSMQNRMADLWRPGKGITIKDRGDSLFLFQFYHIVDLQGILEGGPWSFDNHLFILHHLQPKESPLEVSLVFSKFWIRVWVTCYLYVGEGRASDW